MLAAAFLAGLALLFQGCDEGNGHSAPQKQRESQEGAWAKQNLHRLAFLHPGLTSSVPLRKKVISGLTHHPHFSRTPSRNQVSNTWALWGGR